MTGRDRRQTGLAASIRRLGWPVIESFSEIGAGFWFLMKILTRSGLCLRRFFFGG